MVYGRHYALAHAAALALLCCADPLLAGGTPLASVPIASGLTNSLDIQFMPGDTANLYVAEKAGRLKRIVLAGGASSIFLDISTIVNSSTLEWGLIGFCFDPAYQTSGYVYLHHSELGTGNCIIARYQRSLADPGVLDPTTRTVILFLVQPSPNHRGGWMSFGPDGYLYLVFGDGGGQNDPSNRAQNLTLIQGKMLRIDPSGDDFPADANRNYRIPPDNPFAGHAVNRPEIWAYGLRNPWRNSFDKQTDDLWIGDVGQNQREEINFQPASSIGGENYGWRCTEGTFCTGLSGCTCNGPTLRPPIFEYNHAVGVSITGGYVYRGCAIPDLRGTYFYAEYQFNKAFSLRYQGGVVSDQQVRTPELAPSGGIVGFGQGWDGELYFVSLSNVRKIVPNGVAPAACPLPGDMNCDGLVTVADIGAFVLALTDPAGYAALFPTCDINNGDLNNDDLVSVSDIGPFVALLTGGGR